MALVRLDRASLIRSGALTTTLTGLTFDIVAGETLAVVGGSGSGSGKTTLACWLAGRLGAQRHAGTRERSGLY